MLSESDGKDYLQRSIEGRPSRLARLPDGVGMGDVVNLKRFRKRVDRRQSEQEAQANRTRFGRTKSERTADELRANRANDLLDQHRIDGEDAS
jgi:Domain of unknown function (DUF4169)